MAYERKPGDAVLWVNDKKEKENHPDRKGDGLIHCPQCSHNFEVWLSGWLKKKGDGEPFLSLSIKSKDDPGAGPRAHSRPAARTQEQRREKPIAQRPPPDPDLDAEEGEIPF